jgi:hypothetical protein
MAKPFHATISLILEVCVLACAASVFGQGTVVLNNHVFGDVITHVYGPNPNQPYGQVGNGTNDFPAGTTDWTGYTALSGTEYTVELWAANGANQPESALQPAVPRTTFRTGTGAGWIVSNTATLVGVPADSAVATVTLRVWDNLGGTVTNWQMAQSYSAAFANSGQSPLFNLYRIGGAFTIPPNLDGLQSFGLWSCLGPYFEGLLVQPASQGVVQGGTATFVAYSIACPPALPLWYHDGVAVGWGDQYQITNAQPADAGNYWVVASAYSQLGSPISATSPVATLTVLSPPSITSQPPSQTAEIGSTVQFAARADGSLPLVYRWFFNDTTPLTPPGTDASLLLTNVQPAEAGTYTVVVTNIAGTKTSAPALLSVIPEVPRRIVPGLTLMGQSGSVLNLEFTEALGPSPIWLPLESVLITNASQWYFDLTTPRPPETFYRAWQAGSPSVTPELRLDFVTAISLTGPVGFSLRLDYINQFGPIDSWFQLATVTPTNTSQLFFDTSAIGQPPRLYRVVPLP